MSKSWVAAITGVLLWIVITWIGFWVLGSSGGAMFLLPQDLSAGQRAELRDELGLDDPRIRRRCSSGNSPQNDENTICGTT